MPKFEDLIQRRERIIAEAEAEAVKRLQGIESDSWGYVADLILGLDTKVGKVVFSAKNIVKVNKGVVKFERTIYQKMIDFGKWIAGRFLSIFNLNKSYFKIADPTAPKDYFESAKKLVMLRWGWDIEKNEIVDLGFLDLAFNTKKIAEDVARRMLAGVSGGMDLKTFTETFKAEMLSSNQNNGMFLKEFERAAFDAFQTFDRTAQNKIGDDLGLKYALYSGTKKDNTREFCEKRYGRIFSRDTITGWNDLKWEGKIPGTDVKETLGGYNCRHHLSWMSEEMVELLKKRGTTVDVLG